MESITNRALAGELDSAETTGTSIQLMNYSYAEDAALSKGASSKNRYKINHVADGDTSTDEINNSKDLTSLGRRLPEKRRKTTFALKRDISPETALELYLPKVTECTRLAEPTFPASQPPLSLRIRPRMKILQ